MTANLQEEINPVDFIGLEALRTFTPDITCWCFLTWSTKVPLLMAPILLPLIQDTILTWQTVETK